MARTTGSRAFMTKEGSNSSILHFGQRKPECDISQPGGLAPKATQVQHKSELLNWNFQDWRINHIKIREPKQAPKVWCRSSSPLNTRNNSSSIICAKTGFEHILKRRGRGHPATATIRNKPLTNAKDTGIGLQPVPAPCFWQLSQGEAGRGRGAVWSAGQLLQLGCLGFFCLGFLWVFFSDINRYLPFGCTSY